MTKYRSRILIMALIAMAFTVSTVQAQNSTWEVNQIESGPDDGFITEVGNKFFDTPWVQIKSTTTSLTSYFAFRGVDIPDNVTILNATLQFTAPNPTTFAPNATLDVTIYGLKTGDLTTWDPTPDLQSEPSTTALTNWDATPLSHNAVINVTITDLVIEIYEMNAWTSGNGMGFRVLSVLDPSILAARYQVAYESDPTKAMKLYIEYSESNATTTYYKGYSIQESVSGTGAVLTWANSDEFDFRLTTVDVFNVSTVETYAYPTGVAPDSALSVGRDVYMVWVDPLTPWNNSLRKTTDRGVTWSDSWEISGGTGSAVFSGTTAIAYDLNDTIWISYAVAFDTFVKAFTISNQSMSAGFMIFDGQFNNQEHRAYWDADHDTIYFTRYGGGAWGSARRPTIIRKQSGGSWENYTDPTGTQRVSDVTWAGSNIWWVVHQYSVTASQNFLRMYRLNDINDLTNWTNVGGTVGTLGNFQAPAFDVGVYNNHPVISMKSLVGGYTYLFQNEWLGYWNTNMFNLTGPMFFVPHQFHTPKMYYQGNGTLMMASIIQNRNPGGEYGIRYNDWAFYLDTRHIDDFPSLVPSTPTIAFLGGDMFPYTAGISVFSVYDENGTLIGTFDTLEDAQAGIDDIPGVGQTPDDPNPPGTSYPEEGFGVLTRFNLRFVLWGVGWILIIAPFIIMAVRSWPLKVYLLFVLCIALGFALQWTIGSI